MENLFGGLCVFAFLLAIVTVVGHLIWIGIAAFFRFLSGDALPETSSGKPCPHCHHPKGVIGGRCIACGRIPQVNPGAALVQDLEVTARHLRRLCDRKVISEDELSRLLAVIAADLARLRNEGDSARPKSAAPEPVVAEIVEADASSGIDWVRPAEAKSPPSMAQPPARMPVGSSPFQTNVPLKPMAAASPVAPATPAVPMKPSEPARPLADVLQSFMEESNIRWGEIIAGLLIVVSAVGLIVSLRNTLKAIPYSPAILFMLFTVSFYGAGMYTLRRWKLHAISRVILIISLLLVPLSFSAAIVMSGSGDMQRPVTDPLFIAAVLVGTVVYSLVTFTASRELVGEAGWRLTAALMGASLSQIVINRVAPTGGSLWNISLLAALPVASFLIAAGGQIWRGRGWPRISALRAQVTFLVLGLAAFALVAPLSLLIHHSAEKMVTLGRMTPSLSIAAAGALAVGLLIHRRVLAKSLAGYRTAGTAIALCGGLAMLGLIAVAWPEPELLLAVGLVNFLLLAGLASAGNLSLLHWAAIACAALAALVGFHLAEGRIGQDSTSLDLIHAAFMGRSGILLGILSLGAAGAGIALLQQKRKEDGLACLGGAGGLAGSSILVALVAGIAPLKIWGDVPLDADFAAPILLTYAAVCFGVALFARMPSPAQAAPALAGSALLWIGLAQGLTHNEALRSFLQGIQWLPVHPVLVATIAHAALNLLLAALAAPRLLFASAAEHRDADRLPRWDAAVLPLVGCGAGTLLACTPFLFFPYQAQLSSYSAYAGVAAIVWLAVLVVVRQQAAMYGVQSMLALCAAYAAAAVMFPKLTGEFWYIKVPHLQVQLLLLATGGVLFALLRRFLNPYETIRNLLVSPYPAVDQVLLATAVRMVLGLAVFGAWHGVWFELGVFRGPPIGPLTSQMALASGWEAWLVLAVVLLALAVSLWEKVTLPALMGIAVTLFAIPWLVATWWGEEYAVASAARWMAAVYGVCGASVFVFRTPLLALTQRIPGLSWGKLRRTAYYCTAWQPLAFAGLSILTITVAAVSQQTGGVKLGGPLDGTLFDRMGPTVSYAAPLYAIVAILLGYCLRERQPLFALGGSAVSQFAVNLAFMLRIALGPKTTPPVYAVEWLQWNAIAAGGYGLLWLAMRRWVVPGGKPEDGPWLPQVTSRVLADFQLGIAGAGSLLLVAWSFGIIFLEPAAATAELSSLGSLLSYIAIGLTAAAGLLDGHRHATRQAANLAPLAALSLVTLVAASCDSFDGGLTWFAYHILLMGSLSVAALTAVASTLEATASPQFSGAGRVNSRLVPSHWTALAITLLTAVLAVRGAWFDPQEPWWSVAAMIGVCLVFVIQGIVRRRQGYAYLSLIAAPIAVLLFWLGWPVKLIPIPETFVVEAAVIAVSGLCAIWLSLEIQSQRRDDQPFDPSAFGPPAHHSGMIACVLIFALRLCFGTFVDAAEPGEHPLGRFVPSDLWIAAALVVMAGVLGRSLWDRRAFFALPAAYVVGLLMVMDGLRHANFALREMTLAATIAAAAYVALTGHLWSFGANLAALGASLGISDTVGGLKRTSYWLPAISIGITTVASGVALVAVLAHPQLEWRVATALAPAIAAWGIACLAQQQRKEAAQIGALLLAGLSAVYLAWAQLPPEWTDSLLLARSFRLLMVLSALTFAYGFLLPRYLFTAGDWNSAVRKSGYTAGALAIATFVAVLGLEVAMFVPGQGAPVEDAQVAAVAVVLVALIAGLLSMALLPGKDPLAMGEAGRMFYVYGAQAVGALLFVHLYVCRPMWFDSLLRPYWPFIILGVAFAGIAAAELFKRQKIRVLAEPFRMTGGFLPLIPALAMLIIPAPQAPYELVLFLAGLMYLLLSMLHRSVVYGAAAGVAANAALWVLLEHRGIHFADHPQFWLIPPAAAVLLAAQLNRTRLTIEQLTATRYCATIVIYLSSTAEIFIHSAATNLWPPIILAALSVAGALAGIMLRIRAFLYLGAAFTLMALVSMVWHAARAIDQTWPWWAFGFGMGIALLVLFALFEKKKEEVKLLISRLRSWEQ